MAWKVSPQYKKSVTEVERWSKNGEELVHRIGWRWATITVEEAPDLSDYDPETDEIEVYDEWSASLDSCDDGVWEDWEYPASWTSEDIEKFQELWDEEWHEAPLSLGWQEEDTQLWFTGPLEIEEIEATEDDEDGEATDEDAE